MRISKAFLKNVLERLVEMRLLDIPEGITNEKTIEETINNFENENWKVYK